MRLCPMLVVVALGCAGPPPSDVADELRALEDTAWLVRRVRFERANDDIAAGYDVDGIDERPGTRCADVRDYVSPRDATITGIDNAGQQLIETGEASFSISFQGELDRAVSERRLRWAIRIGRLSPDETSIPVDLVLVDAAPPLALDMADLPAAGQRLAGARITTALATPRGAAAIGDAIAEGLPVDGPVPLLPFDDLRVAGLVVDARLALTERIEVDLGGSFSIAGLDAETRRLLMDPSADSTAIYAAAADVDPDASGRCQRVSVGFTLEAVPLELTLR